MVRLELRASATLPLPCTVLIAFNVIVTCSIHIGCVWVEHVRAYFALSLSFLFMWALMMRICPSESMLSIVRAKKQTHSAALPLPCTGSCAYSHRHRQALTITLASYCKRLVRCSAGRSRNLLVSCVCVCGVCALDLALSHVSTGLCALCVVYSVKFVRRLTSSCAMRICLRNPFSTNDCQAWVAHQLLRVIDLQYDRCCLCLHLFYFC